jgi:hypothetical protein
VYDICLRVTDSFGEYSICCTTVEIIPCVDPDPVSQGYWHRQCLGVPESEGGIDPGREGRGPQNPTEPDFVEVLMPCADEILEDLDFYTTPTCEGMDAYPASDKCEKALKQTTAVILNMCSDRLMPGCAVDLADLGCTSGIVGDLLDELASLIHMGDCDQAQACAAAINEGEGLVIDGGGRSASPGDEAEQTPDRGERNWIGRPSRTERSR